MSYRVELKCDVGLAPEGYAGTQAFCYSRRPGVNPHAEAADDQEVDGALSYIMQYAETHGWHKVPQGWCCPNCWTIFHKTHIISQ
jgi:hypothetical protein